MALLWGVLGLLVIGLLLWMDYRQDKVDYPLYIPYIGVVRYHRTLLFVLICGFVIVAK
jgi:hypothetical protein